MHPCVPGCQHVPSISMEPPWYCANPVRNQYRDWDFKPCSKGKKVFIYIHATSLIALK